MKTLRRRALPTLAVLALSPVPPAAAQVVEYFHLDALGSVRAVTNASGTIIEQHDYMPFGEEWCGPSGCGVPPAGQARRFTGKERDTETGLDYFGARYYSTKNGRFTTVDPARMSRAAIASPQRWNRYAYSSNSPVMRIDPDGKDDFVVFDNFSNADLQNGGRASWATVQRNAEAKGHTVIVLSGQDATVEAYQDALAIDGLHVIVIGHANQDLNHGTNGILLSNGGVGDPGFYAGGTLTAQKAPGPVQAASVNLFACDSSSLDGQYAAAPVFTGVSSGSNGTNSRSLERAGSAFVGSAASRPAARGVRLDRAAAAAQRQITPSAALTKQTGRRSQSVDIGDTVHQRKN